jgi:hypothetical protein
MDMLLDREWVRVFSLTREKANLWRKIHNTHIPRLLEYNRVAPEIFDLNTPKGQENSDRVKRALLMGDANELSLFLNQYYPVYQLNHVKMIRSRSISSKGIN